MYPVTPIELAISSESKPSAVFPKTVSSKFNPEFAVFGSLGLGSVAYSKTGPALIPPSVGEYLNVSV